MQVWSLSQEDPLEEGMETHSSILAWRISWTEEPVGQQSIGLQRVRQDWSSNTHTHAPVRTHAHVCACTHTHTQLSTTLRNPRPWTMIFRALAPGFFPYSPFITSSPVTLASLLFLENVNLVPTHKALNLLLILPRMFFPQTFAWITPSLSSGLCFNANYLEKSSLPSPSKITPLTLLPYLFNFSSWHYHDLTFY